nr:arabinogalactan protein 9 [Centaurium erythraea]
MAASFKTSMIAAMVMIFASMMVMALVPCAEAQAVSVSISSPAPAPAPATTSDGTAIDQGIAYVLMVLALVLTYIIHVSDILI